MKVTNQEYNQMTKYASPPSKVLKNCLFAFLVGGLICVIGQVLADLFYLANLSKEDSALASTITLVALSAITTALKIYDNLAKYGGAGTLVPITGFANAIVSPAMEFKGEGYIIGIGGKLFTIAGPVLVYGIAASLLYGLILWII